MEPKKIYLLAAICYTIGISVLSLISLSNVVNFETIENNDKYVHFLFYFLFTFLWGMAFRFSEPKKNILIFLCAIAYGIVMEIAQGVFTISRQPDILDVAANTAGAFVGWIALIGYFKFFKSSH